MKLEFDPSRNCFYPKDNKELAELSFCSSVLSKDDIEKRSHYLLQHVEMHPEALLLLKNVLNRGPVKVEFSAHETMTTTAVWNRNNRSITIANNQLEYDLLDSFIWELCNADNKELEDITVELCKSAKEYATKIEMGEYQTLVRTVKLTEDGYKKYGWAKEKEVNPFRKSSTLEEYLSGVQEPSLGHHGFSHFGNIIHRYLQCKKIDLEISCNKINTEIGQIKLQLIPVETRLSYDKLILIHNMQKPSRSADEIDHDKAFIQSQEAIIKKHEQDCESLQKEIQEILNQMSIMETAANSAKLKLQMELKADEERLRKNQELTKQLQQQELRDKIATEYYQRLAVLSKLLSAGFEIASSANSQHFEKIDSIFKQKEGLEEIKEPTKQDFDNLKTWTDQCNKIITDMEFERDSQCCTRILSWVCCIPKPPTQQQKPNFSDELITSYFKP